MENGNKSDNITILNFTHKNIQTQTFIVTYTPKVLKLNIWDLSLLSNAIHLTRISYPISKVFTPTDTRRAKCTLKKKIYIYVNGH